MKIAIVTEDGKTISAHFGRAPYYAVVTVEDGRVVGQEMRDKHAHHGQHNHGGGTEIHLHEGNPQAEDTHNRMAATIQDCEVVIARGMGSGAHTALRQAGLRPIITDARAIDEAVRQYLAGELVDHPERLH